MEMVRSVRLAYLLLLFGMSMIEATTDDDDDDVAFDTRLILTKVYGNGGGGGVDGGGVVGWLHRNNEVIKPFNCMCTQFVAICHFVSDARVLHSM